LKILSDEHNHRPIIPSPEHGHTTREKEFQTENVEMEGGEENQKEELGNVFDHKTKKK